MYILRHLRKVSATHGGCGGVKPMHAVVQVVDARAKRVHLVTNSVDALRVHRRRGFGYAAQQHLELVREAVNVCREVYLARRGERNVFVAFPHDGCNDALQTL